MCIFVGLTNGWTRKCTMLTELCGQGLVEKKARKGSIPQVHPQIRSVADRDDAILGRVKMQANTTVNMVT